MKNKFILLLSAILLLSNLKAQSVFLHYTGQNAILIKVVAEANRILSDTGFINKVSAIQKFDNTTFSGKQIIEEMRKVNTIEITEYYRKHTKTNAITKVVINVNTAKLDRHFADMVNTLIHETIHAVDWKTNEIWDYTHRNQKEEIPAISAPWVIGEIGENMIKQ